MINKKSSVFFKLFLTLFAAGSFSSLFAVSTLPDCGAGTLGGYISSNTSCAIGVLDYSRFSYIQDSNAPSAANIAIAPGASGFSFGPVTALPGQTVQFEIDYDIFIDPTPVITGDNLGLDVSGSVSITEYFCNDQQYFGNGQCLGGPAQSLTVVSNNGQPAQASITFNPPASTSQEVGIVFTLVGGANGASFQGLDSESIVVVAPEPASMAFTLFGFVALAGGYKLRKRSNR